MNWYYALEGQQKGPVSDMEFTTLARDGVIKPKTLVWQEGMAEWQPLEAVRPELVAPPPVKAPVLGGVVVPVESKDVVVQQLREGVQMPGNVTGARYAGFWIRVAAKIIDWVALTVVNYALMFLLFGTMFMTMDPQKMQQMEENPEAMAAFWVSYFSFIAVSMGLQVGYNALLVWKYGATLGKLAVGVRVVRADGEKLGFGRSLGRAFADFLNGFTCLLTYLMPAFDEPQKRGLHDHICATRVVYK